MRIWKVVQRDADAEWQSCIVARTELACQYGPGHRTVAPEGTLLLAFRTLADAIRFYRKQAGARDSFDWELWAAEGEGVEQVGQVLARPWFVGMATVRRFWTAPALLSPPIYIGPPPGTVGCTAITLEWLAFSLKRGLTERGRRALGEEQER